MWVTALRVSELLEKGRREDSVRLLASVRSAGAARRDRGPGQARCSRIGEKRKRTDDQLRFNTLVTEWPELVKERA